MSAYERLQLASDATSGIIVTKRNVASIISLVIWMAGTLQIHLSQHFDIMRIFARVEADPSRWDDKYTVNNHLLNSLRGIVGTLTKNSPVVPSIPPLPSTQNSTYEAVAIVDACRTGWGAYVIHNNNTYRLLEGWSAEIPHSAWAEPRAAERMVQWMRNHLKSDGAHAIITDHPGHRTAPTDLWQWRVLHRLPSQLLLRHAVQHYRNESFAVPDPVNFPPPGHAGSPPQLLRVTLTISLKYFSIQFPIFFVFTAVQPCLKSAGRNALTVKDSAAVTNRDGHGKNEKVNINKVQK
eukprot:PhM_4_TR9790/c1_g1_i4/m.24210